MGEVRRCLGERRSIEYAQRTWKRFADKLHPEFEAIRKFAVTEAAKQSYLEDLQFITGLQKGMTLMVELRKTIRKAVTKSWNSTPRNGWRFICLRCANGRLSKRGRGEFSWPELSEAFSEAFDHRIEIDEDAFKKILQRCGLGVGKAWAEDSSEVVNRDSGPASMSLVRLQRWAHE